MNPLLRWAIICATAATALLTIAAALQVGWIVIPAIPLVFATFPLWIEGDYLQHEGIYKDRDKWRASYRERESECAQLKRQLAQQTKPTRLTKETK